jgi:hypothetical protein
MHFDRESDAPNVSFKRGDSERKRKILELLRDGLGPTAIARIVGGSESSVRKVRDADTQQKVDQAGQGSSWYQLIADHKLTDCTAAARNKIQTWNTEVADSVPIRDITEKELKLHTYPHTIYKSDDEEVKKSKLKAGRRWMQERLTDSPRVKHQGFVIFPPNPDIDYTVVNERFPQLLDEINYQKQLHSIFQSVQGENGRGSSMGDKKRKQAKMSAFSVLAGKRVKEAESKFNKFLEKTVSDDKTEALEKLRETEAEKELVHEVIQHMCDNYNRVQEVSCVLLCQESFAYQYAEPKFNVLKVWPSEHNMPKRVGDAEGLACLESLCGAKTQGFHCDSRKPGGTALTSYEQDQFIYVLFFAFYAMRVLEELRKDRQAATEYVRSRLAALPEKILFSPKEWKDVAEPGIWQFLVHEEFKVRKVPRFEVVRVPLRKDHTGALDTRCPHAGAPWYVVRRAYRGHFYGYERDLQKQTPEQVADKDEYSTVDLCDNDLFPIVGWAQLDSIFKPLVQRKKSGEGASSSADKSSESSRDDSDDN